MFKAVRLVFLIDAWRTRHGRRNMRRIRFVGIIDQMIHDPILLQVVEPIDEIFPHQVFGEGEPRQGGLIHDFKTGNIANFPSHLFEDQRHVHAAVVCGEVGFQVGNVAGEVFLEQLNECRVETNFVFVMNEVVSGEARSCGQVSLAPKAVARGTFWRRPGFASNAEIPRPETGCSIRLRTDRFLPGERAWSTGR